MEHPFDLAASAVTPTPRGRAVLCVWVSLPGAVGAPFAFWQGAGWGFAFCAAWCALVFVVWARACSFVAALDERITSALIFRTPLLRLAGACVLVIFTPGMWAVLPGIPLEAADAVSAALLAGEDAA